MTFDTFVETAWNEHGDRPQEVADRLAASLDRVELSEHIPPFARLVTHVFGEHLAQWQQGIELLERLRTLRAFDGGSVVTAAVARSVGTLRYARGDTSALESLAFEDRIYALAAAAAVFAGRNEFKQALAAYAKALQLASPGLPSGSPALRALAVGGNNLAAALEEKKDRDGDETQGMIAAARGGLKYWKVAGTWLEEERAEYRLARSLMQAGDASRAVEHAQRCVNICQLNNAPSFEQFFGFATLAAAQRATGGFGSFEASRKRALELYAEIPEDERRWCENEVKELGD